MIGNPRPTAPTSLASCQVIEPAGVVLQLQHPAQARFALCSLHQLAGCADSNVVGPDLERNDDDLRIVEDSDIATEGNDPDELRGSLIDHRSPVERSDLFARTERSHWSRILGDESFSE